ncbi:hypothetical protein DFQ26_009713, partial [Actinomortierella ambigua]
HRGLVHKGEELQRKWGNNTYKHVDDMHWALQKRKRSAKLQSVKLRMNDQRDEAFEALESIKDRKKRVMFAT